MHNPEGTPTDFVDWEKVRQTKEYQKHMATFLQIRLEKAIHSPDYWERIDRRDEAMEEECDESASPEELFKAAERLETRTEEEQDIDAEISGLRTIPAIEAYVRAHNVDMDVEKEVRDLEETYLSDQRRLEELKEEFGPLLDETREFFGWKKPKEPDVQ